MNQRTVLVVDDDDDIRQLLEIALEVTTDWRVISASDGAAAVTMVLKHLPDAVLMDLMMPGMDGLTAFEALQADEATCDIPVIMVTAKLRVGDRRPWDGYALSGVIPKPFNPMAMAAQIAALLNWPTPVGGAARVAPTPTSPPSRDPKVGEGGPAADHLATTPLT